MPTEQPDGSSNLSHLLDDGLDDDMAALPLDSLDSLDTYHISSSKRANEQPASEQPVKQAKLDEAAAGSAVAMTAPIEFAEYDQYNTADLLSLPEWSECGAGQESDTSEVVKQMRCQHWPQRTSNIARVRLH